MPTRILIVEPDSAAAGALESVLAGEGYRVTLAKSGKEALEAASKSPFEFFVIDASALEKEEVSLLHFLRSRSPHAFFVLTYTPQDAELAVRAAQHGPVLSLLKPVRPDDLRAVLNRLKVREEEGEDLPDEDGDAPFLFFGLAGKSAVMRRVLHLAGKVAATDSTVIISGESGTGKEMIAKIIQRLSPRAEKPFVTLNCGAIPENLVESELFGHKRGAFTGAVQDKKGLLEMAHLGTIMLDEISELPLPAQVKLLRAIEELEIRRVGEVEPVRVDVRVIVATNKDLRDEMAKGKFREDLWYRLNVVQIHVAPLRDRREDIPVLMSYFLNEANRRFRKNVVAVAPDALAVIGNYGFPGNVRELRNVIEHGVVMSNRQTIRREDLPPDVIAGASRHRLITASGIPYRPATGPAVPELSFKTIAEAEKELIEWTLARLNGNQSEVSRRLGISRSTLWRKIKQYGLTV